MALSKTKALKLVAKTLIYAFAGFGIIFVLMLLGVLGLMSPKSRLSSIPHHVVLNIDFNQSYAEVRQDDFFAEFTNQSVYSVFDLVRAINFAASDDRVKAIAANVNGTSLSLAQIQDVAEALKYFQSKGKKAYLFSNGMGAFGGGTKEYYLATLFNEIWMQPHSEIGMTGVDIEVPFLKNVLQKVGVEPEFYTRYEYKTAVASILHSDWTPTYKEELTKLGGGLFNELLLGIASQRNFDVKNIKDTIDHAPVFASTALENGLIDKIVYRYDFQKTLSQRYQAEFYDMTDYMAHISDNEDKNLPQVAFMVLEGVIESGESSNNPLNDAIIGSETVLEQINELKKVKNLKALVLRINSPGGSYTASDEIRAALVNLKVEKQIPIVVSMSTYAASGGYFVSLAGDYVFADPATITGSIGVLGGKIVVSDLMKKLDINWGELKFGENAGILSIQHKFSDAEREVFERSLDEVYQDFTTTVSNVRKIDMAQMDRIARGRVWLGRDAQGINLVDELGGLQRAILKAKELSSLKPEDSFSLQYYPKRETFQEKLTKFIESGGSLPMMKVLDGFEELKVLYRLRHNTILPPMLVKM